jgi:hypothetical protein
MLHLSLSAQNLFIVDHPDKSKRIRFREHQEIKVITFKSEVFRGYIKSIEDSIIDIAGAKVHVGAIQTVVTEKRLIGTLSRAFSIAGVAYFSLDLFNAVTNGDKPLVSIGTLIPAASITAFGAALSIFSERNYHRKRGYRFKIIDTSP